jgi:hypothetical protein
MVPKSFVLSQRNSFELFDPEEKRKFILPKRLPHHKFFYSLRGKK